MPVSRIPVRATSLTGTVAVIGSVAILAVNAVAEKPASSAAVATVEPRDQAAIQAERDTAQLWQLEKLHGIDEKREALERKRERARQRAIARREARERAAERAAREQEREALYSGDPRAIAQSMLGDYGWAASEFSCLDALWERESGWDSHASNPSSGAYGIPQALPGSKMASAGSDWEDNPATQIEWGLGYISDRYGSPCGAWDHAEANGWY